MQRKGSFQEEMDRILDQSPSKASLCEMLENIDKIQELIGKPKEFDYRLPYCGAKTIGISEKWKL
ncbi:MAG: hypothetical protein FWG75_00690 [Cystobacterineae bacterium]|nr:hypothetical protein [Cystobacterineae bacterium]